MRILSLSLLASASVLAAQTPADAHARALHALDAQTVILSGQQTLGCPVAFSAKRTPDGNLVQTRNSQGRHSLGLLISFGQSTANAKSIAQASITLHGLEGAQVLPAGAVGGDGTATEQFTLSSQPDHGFDSVVYAHKLTGIQSIELNELTYTDGTQWHEAAEHPCRITPNGFLLVKSGQ